MKALLFGLGFLAGGFGFSLFKAEGGEALDGLLSDDNKSINERLEIEWAKVKGGDYSDEERKSLTEASTKFERIIIGIDKESVRKNFKGEVLRLLLARNILAGVSVSDKLGEPQEALGGAKDRMIKLSRRSDCGLTPKEKHKTIHDIVEFLKRTT